MPDRDRPNAFRSIAHAKQREAMQQSNAMRLIRLINWLKTFDCFRYSFLFLFLSLVVRSFVCFFFGVRFSYSIDKCSPSVDR